MDMFRAMRHQPFRLLWSSVLLVQLGYWFTTIAFQWEVAHLTDNDPMALGLLYFAAFAPYLLFSLPAGALADSRDRRTLLLTALGCSIALATVCVLLALLDAMPIWIVLPLAFLSGCVVTVVSPANQALTASAVPAADLGSAVPVQSMGLNLARIVGPALAGPVLLFSGSAAAFGVYALTCVSAMLLAWRLQVRRVPLPALRESTVRRVMAGIAHARARPPAATALAVVAVTSVFGSAFQSQMPVLGAQVAEDGDAAFLALVVTGGVGSLLGVITVARRREPATLVSASRQLAALGVTAATLGVVHWFPLMMLLVCVAGGLTFSIMTSINTMLQHVVEDGQRGRVLSLYFLCWGGLLPFGGLGIGSLIGAAGAAIAFAVAGVVAAVAGVAIAWRGRRRDV
ncbi:MFS transporter [Lentzea albidocapillata]|uniref:Predicted arabinose efflux permease, MFS family n=1 Tax=Lentzea albidocapillata TaxID=40571 RepID=A0A1W2DF83_9PSEU|nr:MFS transporter [Lentzea albidocapillata]SMC96141.1 Predicted arabinose efflux permease, MFS family [Lentzea albidocapillata]